MKAIVGEADQIKPGDIKPVEIGSTAAILVNADGSLCALQRRCPHMGADLSRGKLVNGLLVCPRHAAAFDPKTGKAVDPAKVLFLKFKTKDAITYPVRIEAGFVTVDAG